MPWEEIADPFVILAPERSNGSILCAMLGQHPEMCALLETRLFARGEMEQWIHDFGGGAASHGLLRSVAEIVFGRQSEQSINQARKWLLKRANRSTIDVFSELAAIVHPLFVVERTPIVTYRPEHMCRVRRHFPDAKFLHLIVHPVEYAHSLNEYFQECFGAAPERTCKLLSNSESIFFDLVDMSSGEPRLDPSRSWRRRHISILKFLASIPTERQTRIRLEDLRCNPRQSLRQVVEWLGLRSDFEALESMLDPKESTPASFGSEAARFGSDTGSLREPRLQALSKRANEAGELERHASPIQLTPEVEDLARYLGYS
jgi:Sulfotransferase family